KGALHTEVDNVAASRALAGEAGNASFRDLEGRQAIGGYDRVEGLGWAIVVLRARSTALAAVSNQQRLAVLLIVLGALLAIMFSVWFARKTTRPILSLAETAERVADGDLDARVEIEGASELRRLGTAFNAMVESLGRIVAQTSAASTEVNAS